MKHTIAILFLLSICAISCTKAIIDPDAVNTPSDTTNIITDTMHYGQHIEPILTSYCITCHGGAAPSAGLLLNNYNDVVLATQSGNLIERINDEVAPMPSSGLMPEINRAKIQKWADDGFLP